jgi:hypothetical protein
MARINWLADVLRAGGVQVREESGWKTRGRDDFDPQGIVIHATAGGLQQSNDSALGVIMHGRPGLSPPIGHAMGERGTGVWRIVASGASNHARTGTAGNMKNHGNRTLIGVEWHHNNLDEPWPANVYRSYVLGVAAICRRMGWAVNRITGHKEHQPGEKSDPTFNMNQFRADVAAVLAGTPQGDDDVATEIELKAARIVEAWNNGMDRTTAGENVEPVKWESRRQAHEARVEALLGELQDRLAAVEARPGGTLALTEQDKADLIAGFGTAAEAAVRKVLGAVDGATPPA